MKKLTLNDPETQSLDGIAENIRRLKDLFPELVTEGANGTAVNVDVLKALVGDATVTDANEKYALNWHGKRSARQLALAPSTGTLRPCPENSVDWDTTQNLMIEGDNLEVLKLLQKSYAGKVKLIYIDPPYNTGNEFIYPDDFGDSIRNYLNLTGQVDGGSKTTSNTELSGRFHTRWLNMMSPRLALARTLLRQDGLIAVSIDDNELYHLRALMNEVFGEENFIAVIIWQKVYSPKNSARHFSVDHDYIVLYAKAAEVWRPQLLPRTEEANARYQNPDNDPRGPWKPSDLTARNYYSKGRYEVTGPTGKKFTSGVGRYWRQSNEAFFEMDADKRIWWGPTGDAMPAQKRFLSEVQQGITPQTIWKYAEVGHTQEAKKELLEHVAFGHNENVLNSVKPTRLLRRLVSIGTTAGGGDIVLDFFSGSAPTAHAVWAQNVEDGGNRRFIGIQLPELLPKPEAGLRTIADIGLARLRSVSSNLKKDHLQFAADLGFRVFKLDSSNVRAWEPDVGTLEKALLESVEHIKPDRAESDVLYEVLLKLGLDLCVPIERRIFGGKAVHSVGGGVLIACLAPRIHQSDVETLAHGIVDWHKALAPAGATTCVFRDSAFADDVVKTNMAVILKQYGIASVWSL